MGKIFGTVKVTTGAIPGEYAFIDTHDLGQLVSCEEVLIQQIYDLSRVPFVPDIVVDCGSHIGLFSLVAGLKYPSAALIAYEPEPENFRVLQKQLRRFGERVTVVNAAVSDHDGEAEFIVFQSNCGHLTEGHHAPVAVADAKRLCVPTIDLAAETEKWQGHKLLLKIDIEGTEACVVPRLIRKLPPQTALFIELHFDNSLSQNLREMLAAAGFTISATRLSAESSDWFALRAV